MQTVTASCSSEICRRKAPEGGRRNKQTSKPLSLQHMRTEVKQTCKWSRVKHTLEYLCIYREVLCPLWNVLSRPVDDHQSRSGIDICTQSLSGTHGCCRYILCMYDVCIYTSRQVCMYVAESPPPPCTTYLGTYVGFVPDPHHASRKKNKTKQNKNLCCLHITAVPLLIRELDR